MRALERGLAKGTGMLALALALACGPARDGSPRTPLAVFAASSLTEAFEGLERGFEEAHPDVDVELVFAGSQVLRVQIEQGARADVFASANEDHMRALVEAGLATQSHTFAHNELVVIVPVGDPAGIEAFEDLPRAHRIVIGTQSVPVGVYTRELLARTDPVWAARVQANVVSEESNVRLVRTKVELGEADAAIVYRTDAAASERIRLIPIPPALNVRASYPIATLTASAHSAQATAFVDYVLSPAGRERLAADGFVTP